MSNVIRFALALTLLSALSAFAFGQSAVTGAVSGTVSDPSGAVIPNAAVSLLSAGTNREETATTEAEGRFKFTNLQPGLYMLTVKAAGFSNYKQDQITVEVGRTTSIEAVLKLGGAEATVEIVAADASTDSSASSVRSSVSCWSVSCWSVILLNFLVQESAILVCCTGQVSLSTRRHRPTKTEHPP